jgi:hypothetical protein
MSATLRGLVFVFARVREAVVAVHAVWFFLPLRWHSRLSLCGVGVGFGLLEFALASAIC